MKCELIQDLLPLYHDECCSDESVRVVEEHLETCPACRAVLQDIKTSLAYKPMNVFPKLELTRHWRASTLQILLFILAFGMLFLGAMAESMTNVDSLNGIFALRFLVPGVACLFSLTNWFFLRLYKNRKRFVAVTAIVTWVVFAAAFVWVCLHYAFFAEGFSTGMALIKRYVWIMMGSYGWLFAAVLLHCALSPLYAYLYARWLGKE